MSRLSRSAVACSLAFLTLAATGLSAQNFTNPYHIPTSVTPATLAVGDLNGDGRPDIVWIQMDKPSTAHILLAQANGTYLAAANVSMSGYDESCVLDDFNQDHHLDLACSEYSASGSLIQLFLGNGDGTFQTPIMSPVLNLSLTDPYPFLVKVGDLNGDGFPDLLEEEFNGNAQALLGDGKGNFTPAPGGPLVATLGGGLTLVADLNGDGHPDLFFPGGPFVALGHGDGSFAPAVSYATGTDPLAVCGLHDMDGDGHPDAVCGYVEASDGDIVGANDLIILHGNADGSFNTTPISDKTFGDKDSQYDGNGTFRYPIAIADLNGDGIPDVLATSGDGAAVLLGGANLTFSTPLHYAVANFGNTSDGVFAPYEYTTADMNGDGLLDIVSTGLDGIYISYGKKDGSFLTAFAPEVAETLGLSTVADFNGDGIPDIAATGDTAIKLSLGKGDGTFSAPTPLSNNNGAINFSLGQSGQIVHGDFNGDGKQDLLAIGSPSTYEYGAYLLFGKGDGTFQAPLLLPNSSTAFRASAQLTDASVFDINKDGRSDLLSGITPNSPGLPASILFALSNGDGTFTNVSTTVPTDLQDGNYAFLALPALADFNGDGKLDAAYGSVSNAYVVNGHGDGTFDTTSTPLPIPAIDGIAPFQALSTVAGDFDGDGNQDFAVLVQYQAAAVSTGVWVFYGNGNGTFSTATLAGMSQVNNFTNIAAADLAQSGRSDIVLRLTTYYGTGYVAGVLFSQPGRTFAPEVDYAAGNGLTSLAIADVNKDGLPDLIFGNGDFNLPASSVTVLLNLGDSSKPYTSPASSTSLTCSPASFPIGANSLFSVSVASASGSPTGSIDFTDNGVALSQATLTNSATTLTYLGQTSGTHKIVATYTPAGFFLSSSASYSVTVAPLPSTATLSVNPSSTTPGTSVTLTATVAPATPPGQGAPTGSVTFYNGTTALNTTPLSSGVGSFTTTSLPAGADNLSCTYSGDSVYQSSTCNTVSLANNPLPADFTLTGTAVTFASGSSGTGTLSLASLNGFAGNVAVTCSSSLPGGYACKLQQSTVALTSAATAGLTYTIQASSTASASVRHPLDRASRIELDTLLPLTLLSLGNLARKRRKLFGTLFGLVFLAILASFTSACGGSPKPNPVAGTYPITFTAIGTPQGNTTPITHPHRQRHHHPLGPTPPPQDRDAISYFLPQTHSIPTPISCSTRFTPGNARLSGADNPFTPPSLTTLIPAISSRGALPSGHSSANGRITPSLSG
jgi:hypothetical protein